jgi:hypothetical protein
VTREETVFKEQIARLQKELIVVFPPEKHAEITELATLLDTLPPHKHAKMVELAAMSQEERSMWAAEAPSIRLPMTALAMAISGLEAVPAGALTPVQLTTLVTVVRIAKFAVMAETLCACAVALSPMDEAELVAQARSVALAIGELATRLDGDRMVEQARSVGETVREMTAILDQQERIQGRRREMTEVYKSSWRLACLLPPRTCTNVFGPFYEEMWEEFVEATGDCDTKQEFDELVRVFSRKVAWAVVSSYRVHILEALVENQNYIVAALGVLTALFAFLKSMMEFARLFP